MYMLAYVFFSSYNYYNNYVLAWLFTYLHGVVYYFVVVVVVDVIKINNHTRACHVFINKFAYEYAIENMMWVG